MTARAIVNAHVHPMDTPAARSDAIAWENDTIVALGHADVTAWATTKGITPEDGKGRAIIPGFVDAHMHFLHVGVKRTRPDLRGAHSKEEAFERVRAWLAAHPGVGAVTAEGWDEAEWTPRQVPTRQELDAIRTEPLVLRRICGHKAVANTAALALVRSEWDDERVDLETGVLLEEPSLYLNQVLPADDATLDAAVKSACQVAHHLGVTSIGDYEQDPFRAALMRAAASGDLSARVQCSIYVQFLEQAIEEGFRTGRAVTADARGVSESATSMFRDGGLKVFLDGSLGGHTALMIDPYDDKPSTRGRAIWTDEELDRLFETAHQAGIQIHAHVIGDGAIEQGLQAFERLKDKVGDLAIPQPDGQPPLRHRFEHYEIAHEGQVVRTAALGIWSSSQPNFVGAWSSKGGMYEERIGERFHLNNRFRQFKDAGVDLAFGSDGMPFGPLYGIQSAREHPVEAERLRADEAVWHYTHEGARSMGRHDLGHLSPGAKADVLILDVEDLEADSSKQWVIQETILAGETVATSQRVYVSDDDVVL